MTSQPLQSSVVAEEHRRGLFDFELRDGVPAYEAMVDAGETFPFPAGGRRRGGRGLPPESMTVAPTAHSPKMANEKTRS